MRTTNLTYRADDGVADVSRPCLADRCPDGGAGGTPGAAHSHAETGTGAMLSVVAGLTPYSDYNQSPRNMYQCQMGKQTMGTPVQVCLLHAEGHPHS